MRFVGTGARTLGVGALVLLALSVGSVVGQQVAAGVTVELMINTIRRLDPTLIGAGVLVDSAAGGPITSLDRAKGMAGAQRDRLFTPDSCVSMNTMGELLVAYAGAQLLADTRFAASLDDVIDTTLSPAGLTLQANGQRLTYKMLLTHTSTITDALFGSFSTTAPNAVGTLTNFVESYFVTTGGQLNTAVFAGGTAAPGTANAYSPARANIALMAYILERVIVTRSVEQGTLQRYIFEKVLKPFKMSSTFFLKSDGRYPVVTAVPVFSTTYDPDFTLSSNYNSYFTQCAADELAARTLHPAWPADFMGITTLRDMAKLARALVIESSTIGVLMQERLLLTSAPQATLRQAQVAQGLGLQYFNGDRICQLTTATSVVSSCPVTNLSSIVGYVAARGASLVGFLCHNPGPATGFVCVSAAFVHGSSNAGSFDTVLQATGAAFQEVFGTTTVVTTPPQLPLRSGYDEEVFGVSVFFGVYLTLLAIFFGTMMIQWLCLPPSLSRVTNTNAFTLGAGTRLSPRRSGPLDRSPVK